MVVESNFDVVNTVGRKRNKAAGGFHATSSLILRERGETRRHVDSMPPRLGYRRKEGKQGGVWAPCCLIFDTPGKNGSEAACGLHTASSSMPHKGVKMRQRVDSTPPCLQCHGKEKRGSMWFPCHLIIDATARRGNNSAWKSGPVWFFIHIWQDWDQDRSSISQILENWDWNHCRPVHSGFMQFFAVARPVWTSYSSDQSTTGPRLVLYMVVYKIITFF